MHTHKALNPTDKAGRRRRAPAWGFVATIIVLAVLAGLPAAAPAAAASVADTLRAIVGPQPVAALESLSFQVQDQFNRLRYRLSGGQAQLSWAAPAAPVQRLPAVTAPVRRIPPMPTPQTAPAPALAQPAVPPGTGQNAPAPSLPTPTPQPNVVQAGPAISGGWQPFGPLAGNEPVMARGSVQPDPSRPYAQAALVRIDLGITQLHLVPGTAEPVAAPHTPAFARPGKIPANVQASGLLLAAFNGGFKAVNGHYGMLVDGHTILPPKPDLATLALYQDGFVRIGAWGRDITLTPDLIAYRQNCPLLIDNGQINPAVSIDNHAEWGYTVGNLDTTWRSGLGISADGRFLIYAVGNSLTVQSLAQALQAAGAAYAMQLDINGTFTRFVTYQPTTDSNANPPVVAQKLLTQMLAGDRQFLVPYDRDFIYLTLLAPSAPLAATTDSRPAVR